MTQEQIIQKAVGNINVSYDIQCPYCEFRHDDHWDSTWWGETFGLDFPVDNGHKQEFEATCKECNKKFIVDGFGY